MADVKEVAASPPLKTSPAERPIHLEPITIPEKLGAGLLMFATLAIGIYLKGSSPRGAQAWQREFLRGDEDWSLGDSNP